MKKITRITCLFLILTLLSGCSLINNELREIRKRNVLRVGVKMDVPSFGFLNPQNNELEGFEIDLAYALAKNLMGEQAEVEFVGVSSKIRGPLLKNDGIDVVIATFTITEERKEEFNFSRPYYVDQMGFMVLKDSPIRTMDDMKNKVIGVAQTSTAQESFIAEAKRNNISAQFKEFASYPEIINALHNGDIDVFTTDRSIMQGYITDETKILEVGFNPQNYGIATKLENTTLAKRVDQFIKNIEKNGELDALLEKWSLN